MMRIFVLVLAFWFATTVWAGGTTKGINWNECYKDIAEGVPGADFRFECAQVRVPLDYSQEHGPVISLALVRIPASDTINYRGSLFVNPGGPGGSGVDFVLAFGPFAQFVFGPVATQYDIIGFDPRGIGRSTGLRCFGNLKQAEQAISPFPFPMEEQEVPLFEAADLLLDSQCDQRGNKILGHTSTANVARDLEYLRNAVGDDRLNFLGLSYGSFLGQTYASLFPDRVGAMVIDGVIDPIAWSNLPAEVPFSVALRSDAGAQATLEEFLRQCEDAGPLACALAPQASDRLSAVLERLRQAPIPIFDPDTGETVPYLYSDAILDLLLGLYSPFDYPDVARFFAFLESLPDPESLGLARSDMQQSIALVNKRGFPKYPNGVEGPPSVSCVDTTNPAGGHSVWFEAGKQATEDYGIFGEAWAWASGPCAVWSSFDAGVYQGPYNAVTANPILLVGNFYDPATRYEGALAARSLLDGSSALLSVDEPGHTSLGLSACAGFVTGLYLSDPQFYAPLVDGFQCASEGNWFEKFPTAASDGDLSASLRVRVMEHVAFRP